MLRHADRKCGHPDCKAKEWEPLIPNPAYTCGKPIWISIPNGGHIHPCPVHPDVIMYGPQIRW